MPETSVYATVFKQFLRFRRGIVVANQIVLMALGIGLTLPAIVSAAEVTGIKIVDYGIFTYEKIKKIDQREHVSGYRVIGKNPKFKDKTTRIPAIKGLQFGVMYKITGDPKGKKVKIKVVDIFPEGGLNSPETGKTNEKNETAYIRKIGSRYCAGFVFEYTWEMVPGDWTFQLWHEDRMLAEKRFNVFLP